MLFFLSANILVCLMNIFFGKPNLMKMIIILEFFIVSILLMFLYIMTNTEFMFIIYTLCGIFAVAASAGLSLVVLLSNNLLYGSMYA